MTEAERTRQVQRAVAGDGNALQRLIVHYHGPLYGTVDGRMDAAVRRHVDPDDVLQQAYVSAFQAIKGCRFDGPGGFYKWLETIALNQLKEMQRNLRRQKRDIARRQTGSPAATTSYPDLLDRLTSPGSTPSRHLARREAAAAVISSLARLTDDQRQVIRLRFLEGRPVAEVAARLGKSETAIHGLCYRGLGRLGAPLASMRQYLLTR